MADSSEVDEVPISDPPLRHPRSWSESSASLAGQLISPTSKGSGHSLDTTRELERGYADLIGVWQWCWMGTEQWYWITTEWWMWCVANFFFFSHLVNIHLPWWGWVALQHNLKSHRLCFYMNITFVHPHYTVWWILRHCQNNRPSAEACHVMWLSLGCIRPSLHCIVCLWQACDTHNTVWAAYISHYCAQYVLGMLVD